MNLPIIKHEDNRRILTEWISNTPVKRCKVIETKVKCTLGKHYHNKCDSFFYMLKGKTQYSLLEPNTKKVLKRDWLFEGEGISVSKGIVHVFNMFPNTIMLEAATEPYDKEDEIQITE